MNNEERLEMLETRVAITHNSLESEKNTYAAHTMSAKYSRDKFSRSYGKTMRKESKRIIRAYEARIKKLEGFLKAVKARGAL